MTDLFSPTIEPGFDAFRVKARQFLVARIAPQQIDWRDTRSPDASLFACATEPPMVDARQTLRLPREYVDQAKVVSYHRSPDRWNLLYRIAYRLLYQQPALLHDVTDDDVLRFDQSAKSVRRDRHKMTAFVRFREVQRDGQSFFIAFHRPDHFVVRLAASFFVERFRVMNFSILTPDESLHWAGGKLSFGSGADPSAGATDDGVEELWLTYYASIFNPARLNIDCMKREMPVRHWKTLPEARLIPQLAAAAASRTHQMQKAGDGYSLPVIPSASSLEELRGGAMSCRACPHACQATQTVFGTGPSDARVVFVGEQPGDEEDRQGQPFVGPAGQLLSGLLEDAGFDRGAIYLTNAVKHFKFEQRGERRIHATPSARDASMCLPWLDAELDLIRPPLVVTLGATATRSLLGRSARLTDIRGQVSISERGHSVLPTFHPSAILRAATAERSDELRAHLFADLQAAARFLASDHAEKLAH